MLGLQDNEEEPGTKFTKILKNYLKFLKRAGSERRKVMKWSPGLVPHEYGANGKYKLSVLGLVLQFRPSKIVKLSFNSYIVVL